MFGRVEYYCERHRPGVPEKFMEKITTHQLPNSHVSSD